MNRRMTVRQPFNLALTLETGQSFRWRRIGGEEDLQGHWYSGVLGEYLVHLRQTEEGLEYRVGGEHGERHDVDLDQRLHDYFRLDDDIDSIYSQLGQHRGVGLAIQQHPGLRLLRQDPWECLVACLCSGTDNIGGIKRYVERMARLSQRKVRLDGEERFTFPGSDEIANGGQRGLANLDSGRSSRTQNILRLAIYLSHDPLLLRRLADREVSCREAVKLLDSYPGIGPRIAGFVALSSLEKLDAFPVDRWVQRALAHCDLAALPEGLAERVRGSRSLTEFPQHQVAEWAGEYFGQYAGYANLYLFHWIEPHKELVGGKGVCPLCVAGKGEG